MSEPRYQPLPPLTDEEYAALRDDIRQHGLAYPIQTDEQGNIIDGHNRDQICRELGIEPRYEVQAGLSEEDKWTMALRLNNARRQLSPEQKRELIRSELQRNAERSDRAIATLLGVDARTVQRQRHVLFDPPDPVIPDPKDVPLNWLPYDANYFDEGLTRDYPLDQIDWTPESYTNYILWHAERCVTYLQSVADLSAWQLLVPMSILSIDGLNCLESIDWERYPQASGLWARMKRLCERGDAAQKARLAALPEADAEAEIAGYEAKYGQLVGSYWNWHQWYLAKLHGEHTEEAA